MDILLVEIIIDLVKTLMDGCATGSRQYLYLELVLFRLKEIQDQVAPKED